MIKKGGNPSPVQVSEGLKGYNVWVYSKSKIGDDGVVRHHYKTLTAKGKYHYESDAYAVGWDYIDSRQSWSAWRGTIEAHRKELESQTSSSN